MGSGYCPAHVIHVSTCMNHKLENIINNYHYGKENKYPGYY